MSSAASQPRLRLVGLGDAAERADWVRQRKARQDVIRENRTAAQDPTLNPTDPRWVLATRAYSQLQGSTLTPERRERVLRTARALGVRPFDANLIIAIVQDQARRGEGPGEATSTLGLIAHPARRPRRLRVGLRWIAALVSAVALHGLLIWWLLSGR